MVHSAKSKNRYNQVYWPAFCHCDQHTRHVQFKGGKVHFCFVLSEVSIHGGKLLTHGREAECWDEPKRKGRDQRVSKSHLHDPPRHTQECAFLCQAAFQPIRLVIKINHQTSLLKRPEHGI